MTKPISPLRQRMIDDMTFRNMSPSTQKVYTYAVANFSAFHGRSPDKLTIEHVRDYRLHLDCTRPQGDVDQSDHRCLALLLRHDARAASRSPSRSRSHARRTRCRPCSRRTRCVRLLKAVPNLKMRTAFITIYAAGLRVSEVVALTATRHRQRPHGHPHPASQRAARIAT